MRILYLCTFYHRALLFRQQMDALERRGHYVRAFSSAQYGEGVAEKFRPIMDGHVIHRECWGRLDRMLFFPRQRKIERQLERAYDLRSFDILHSHLLLSSGYTALRMKMKYGLPYVVSVRATDLSGFIRLPYFRRMAIRILKESRGVLFLSQSHKEELFRRFLSKDETAMVEAKCAVIGNCLESFWQEHTAPRRERDLQKTDPIRILAVAKIKPIKNLTTAARAVELLRSRGYDATLTVIGECQDTAEYQRIAQFDCVRMRAFMNHEELLTEYRQHDIFLLPSVNETFGRVYLEAMTQGLPVLYTRGQGFDRTFDDGVVGYPVPCRDPAEIAERLEDVIENYRAISARCTDNCALFYEDVIMDRLAGFYEAALEHRPTA